MITTDLMPLFNSGNYEHNFHLDFDDVEFFFFVLVNIKFHP